MSWYAIDSVSDAFDESKSLLFPFSLKRWVVLAVITFFVGGAGNAPSFNQSFDAPAQGGEMPNIPIGDPVSNELIMLAALIVLAILVIVAVLLVVGSIMEFVFVDVLRSRNVRIRGLFGSRTGPGLRLVGFRIGLLLIGFFLFLLVAAPIYAGLVLSMPVALLALLILVPLAIVLGIALAIVQDFTTAFVVPLICERGGGIIATWRSTLWPAVKAEWQQFLLYMVLKWGLGLAVGFVVGIGLAIVLFPLLILVGAGFFAGGGVTTPLLVVAGVFAILLFVLVQIFIQMPVAVFLRYYSLSVLDKTELTWTLYPEGADGETPA